MRGACRSSPAGLVAAALLSVVRAGDHILVTDSAYGPTRAFRTQILSRLGVTTTYYDPLIGEPWPGLCSRTRAPSYQIAGLAELRNSGRASRSGACRARSRMDNTLGDAALFPRLGFRRRFVDPCRHQIFRRPFRRDARHGRGQQRHRRQFAQFRPPERTACRPRRMSLCRPTRSAHARGRLRPAPGIRPRPWRIAAARRTRSLTPAASGTSDPATRCGSASSPARRIVQHGAQTGGGLCVPRYARTIRHRRILGPLQASGHPSIARACARRRVGRRAARPCASISAWKPSKT